MNSFHNEEDEPVCAYRVKLKIDDDKKLLAEDYRDALYKEIKNHRKWKERNGTIWNSTCIHKKSHTLVI